MTKEPQLLKPDSFNKGSCFCRVVDDSIWYPIDSLDVQHDSIAGRAKELIFFNLSSMSLEMTQNSQPYSNTVIQVVLNSFTMVEIGMEGGEGSTPLY